MDCTLTDVPTELLCEHILSRLNANTLSSLEASCRFFRVGRASAGSLAEQAACQQLTTSCGSAEAQRFKWACHQHRNIPLSGCFPLTQGFCDHTRVCTSALQGLQLEAAPLL